MSTARSTILCTQRTASVAFCVKIRGRKEKFSCCRDHGVPNILSMLHSWKQLALYHSGHYETLCIGRSKEQVYDHGGTVNNLFIVYSELGRFVSEPIS